MFKIEKSLSYVALSLNQPKQVAKYISWLSYSLSEVSSRQVASWLQGQVG